MAKMRPRGRVRRVMNIMPFSAFGAIVPEDHVLAKPMQSAAVAGGGYPHPIIGCQTPRVPADRLVHKSPARPRSRATCAAVGGGRSITRPVAHALHQLTAAVFLLSLQVVEPRPRPRRRAVLPDTAATNRLFNLVDVVLDLLLRLA